MRHCHPFECDESRLADDTKGLVPMGLLGQYDDDKANLAILQTHA